jgi:hypothetical protein
MSSAVPRASRLMRCPAIRFHAAWPQPCVQFARPRREVRVLIAAQDTLFTAPWQGGDEGSCHRLLGGAPRRSRTRGTCGRREPPEVCHQTPPGPPPPHLNPGGLGYWAMSRPLPATSARPVAPRLGGLVSNRHADRAVVLSLPGGLRGRSRKPFVEIGVERPLADCLSRLERCVGRYSGACYRGLLALHSNMRPKDKIS